MQQFPRKGCYPRNKLHVVTPEDLMNSERSTGLSNIVCVILLPLLTFVLFTVDTDVLLTDPPVANYPVWLPLRRHTNEMEEFTSFIKQDIHNLYYFVLYTVQFV